MIRTGTDALDNNSVVIDHSLDKPRLSAIRTTVENICNSVGNLDPDNDATPACRWAWHIALSSTIRWG